MHRMADGAYGQMRGWFWLRPYHLSRLARPSQLHLSVVGIGSSRFHVASLTYLKWDSLWISKWDKYNCGSAICKPSVAVQFLPSASPPFPFFLGYFEPNGRPFFMGLLAALKFPLALRMARRGSAPKPMSCI